jgi:hypothetical protein
VNITIPIPSPPPLKLQSKPIKEQAPTLLLLVQHRHPKPHVITGPEKGTPMILTTQLGHHELFHPIHVIPRADQALMQQDHIIFFIKKQQIYILFTWTPWQRS